ncbi:MAG: PKD domain-containing protein, partial [Bacteroidota bacterium]
GTTMGVAAGVIPRGAQGQDLAPITFDFTSVINCAYDPNDKQVHPNRSEQPPFTQNYTLFAEELLYTIRFQNTGTDTAFNVVLRDQLSGDLDWSTFRPGSSSHPYDVTLDDEGLLEFYFRDILLPDSTTNEPLSHGFVDFTISAREDLVPNTSIDNTAGIYFDFNPPIITNMVNSMMLEELPNFTPAAAFTYTAAAATYSFTDASTNDPTSWLWDFGDGTTSTDENPSHTFASNGTYQVCLIAANDWGSNQYCEELMVNVTSVSDLADGDVLQLQPNPASDEVWLSIPSARLPQALTLYTAGGQPLKKLVLTTSRTKWSLGELPAGSYWLRTEAGDVRSLVIVR